jgi:hypothetical protein
VHYARDDVASIFATSARGKAEFPDAHENLRSAVSLARGFQVRTTNLLYCYHNATLCNTVVVRAILPIVLLHATVYCNEALNRPIYLWKCVVLLLHFAASLWLDSFTVSKDHVIFVQRSTIESAMY